MDKVLQDDDSMDGRPKFCRKDFENNNEKCKYFTGIPSGIVLMLLFDLVEPYLPHHPFRTLSSFERFLVTLMRLRLNLDLTFLAYYFHVSRKTVSKSFYECLGVLYNVLKNLVSWPERHMLHANMPRIFQESFGNRVTAIIDCFEIFCERPSNLLARAQTWSNYKHHNTVKYLVGITPYGTISFISEAFGGRTSDKHITEHCGFLDKLRPGDLTLADRGFTVAPSVSLVCAEIRVPAYTRGKCQLSAVKIEKTREIAHVRIHVERVIGSLRQKYTILSGTLPIHMLLNIDGDVAILDKIVTICCALTNLCPSVIHMD